MFLLSLLTRHPAIYMPNHQAEVPEKVSVSSGFFQSPDQALAMHPTISMQFAAICLLLSAEGSSDSCQALDGEQCNSSFFSVGGGSQWSEVLRTSDWRSMVDCYAKENNGIDIWDHERKDRAQNSAEIWLMPSLMRHPCRIGVESCSNPRVTFIPFTPFLSYMLKEPCKGLTHSDRLNALAADLEGMAESRVGESGKVVLVCQAWRCRHALGGPRGRVLQALQRIDGFIAIHERNHGWSGLNETYADTHQARAIELVPRVLVDDS